MSKQESKSYAELEADLFLAERAFKRVPSDENKEALKHVKTAFEALQGVKEAIKAPAAPKEPAKPKAAATTTGKQKAPVSPKAPVVTDLDPDDSKKN